MRARPPLACAGRPGAVLEVLSWDRAGRSCLLSTPAGGPYLISPERQWCPGPAGLGPAPLITQTEGGRPALHLRWTQRPCRAQTSLPSYVSFDGVNNRALKIACFFVIASNWLV